MNISFILEPLLTMQMDSIFYKWKKEESCKSCDYSLK